MSAYLPLIGHYSVSFNSRMLTRAEPAQQLLAYDISFILAIMVPPYLAFWFQNKFPYYIIVRNPPVINGFVKNV